MPKIVIKLDVTDTSVLDSLHYDIKALVEEYYVEDPTQVMGPKPKEWVKSYTVTTKNFTFAKTKD